MNKTVNINLGGLGFTIDEPAYKMLEEYLQSLGEVCRMAGEPETADDIEQRISEILYERYAGGGIVGLADIEEIIVRIGEPEEIVEIDQKEECPEPPRTGSRTTPPPVAAFLKKRLYRDPRNKLLGGVCSGLAWYLGIDPVWVRLIFVALCFFTGVMALIYVILWIVIPEAKTPTEQLQMMGMESSVNNVGRIVTDNVPPPYPREDLSSGKRMASTLAEIFGWIGRMLFLLFVALGLIISFSLLLAFGVGFIACIVALFLPGNPFESQNISVPQLKLLLGCIIGGILVLGIPLILAVRAMIQSLAKTSNPMQPSLRLTLLFCWIVGVAAATTCGILLSISN